MRKILEERLANAKEELELCYAYEDNNYPCSKDDLLLNEINIYEHILKLLPKPRKEQEILKDFEKFGYEIKNGYRYISLCYFNESVITISKPNKSYFVKENVVFGVEEHKLLNELFTLWGWL